MVTYNRPAYTRLSLEHLLDSCDESMRVATAGWVNGWSVPLVPIDHMDDPRSPRTALHTDADLAANMPLSAQFRKTHTLEQWRAHLRLSARAIQEAPADPRLYVGVRKKIRRRWARLRRQEVMS